MVKQKFAVGDVVWAAENGGSGVYESKILKAQGDTAGKLWKYFIHFQGWAKKYDTWIDETRLVNIKDESGKQKLLEPGDNVPKKQKGARVKSEGSEEQTEDADQLDATTIESGSRKRVVPKATHSAEEVAAMKKRYKANLQMDLLDEKEFDFPTKLQIPLTMKKHLVDEWSLITKEPRRLLKLPRPQPVAKVIEDFLEMRAKKLDREQFAGYRETFDGLRMYFDKALPTILLYRYERDQLDALSKALEDIPYSSIYGAEHILRLFVRLPRMFSTVFLPQTEILQIESRLIEFLKFIHKNSSSYIDIGEYALVDEAMAIIAELSSPSAAATAGSLKAESGAEIASRAGAGAGVGARAGVGSGVKVGTHKHTSSSPAPVAAVVEFKFIEPLQISAVTGRPVRKSAGKNTGKWDD